MKDTFRGQNVLTEYEQSVAAEKAAAEKAAAEKVAQAAAAAPPAPGTQEPPKPAAETPPAAAAPKEEPPKETPPAQAAGWRKKIKGKVDGQEREWELAEEDLDETKNPEGYKKLVERFQKAEDYDRPGGALDKQAAKLAAERHAAFMVERGFWVKNPDGSYANSPAIEAYQAWRAQQAQAQQQAAAQPKPAASQEPTPRQQRIKALEVKYDTPGSGLTAAEMREYQELISEEKFDAREAERETRRRAEAERTAAESAAQSAQERALQERIAKNEAYIDSVVDSLKPQLRHPITGEIDPIDVANLKHHMSAVVIDTRDWGKAEQSVRNFAARTATKMKEIVDRIPKQATAPPPAPVHRGSEGGQNGKPEEPDGFDPRKPFSRQTGTIGAWEKATAGDRR